jgi:hypothetical protein
MFKVDSKEQMKEKHSNFRLENVKEMSKENSLSHFQKEEEMQGKN